MIESHNNNRRNRRVMFRWYRKRGTCIKAQRFLMTATAHITELVRAGLAAADLQRGPRILESH